MKQKINLWLDDIRVPPPNWVWAKTVDEAKPYLERGEVLMASLDHDLGACENCLRGRGPEQWLEETDYQEMPNCEHFGRGLDLVLWMEQTGNWPDIRPQVHSRNRKGAIAMIEVINRKFQLKRT